MYRLVCSSVTLVGMSDVADDTAAGYRIGYARCSTEKQDLRAQKSELAKLGPDRVFTDEGYTGTKRDSRAGLDQSMAALRAGDTLIVTKLDRLARSVPDARAIATEVESRGARLQIGTMLYDPSDPMGKMFFNVLAMFAEFEADLARMRTREGMAEARRAGKLRGKPPKFTARQDAEVRRMRDSGNYTIREIAGIFTTTRPTIYRSLTRTQPAAAAVEAPAEQHHPDEVSGPTGATTTREDDIHETDISSEPAVAGASSSRTGSSDNAPAAAASTENEVRAIRTAERIDPDTVTTTRNPVTGTTRVLATAETGESVLVGFLDRQGRQWHAQTPHMTSLPGHWRTKNEALLRLVEPHAK